MTKTRAAPQGAPDTPTLPLESSTPLEASTLRCREQEHPEVGAPDKATGAMPDPPKKVGR